jgi:hypothetical protein
MSSCCAVKPDERNDAYVTVSEGDGKVVERDLPYHDNYRIDYSDDRFRIQDLYGYDKECDLDGFDSSKVKDLRGVLAVAKSYFGLPGVGYQSRGGRMAFHVSSSSLFVSERVEQMLTPEDRGLIRDEFGYSDIVCLKGE